MPARNRALFLPALILASLTVAAPASWGADEPDQDEQRIEEVRRLVQGHEAFIQRCIADTIRNTREALGVDSAPASRRFLEAAKEAGRSLCDMYYEGVSVCADGGPALAIERLEEHVAEADSILSDPLTRANEFRNAALTRDGLRNEISALRDLMEGRPNYCNRLKGE